MTEEKKAIASDAVKRDPKGRLSKGLGDVPGREAPKPVTRDVPVVHKER